MRDIAVFMCDVTGKMAEPWAEAGIECYCVDVQHSIRKPRKEGNINFVWGDARTWTPPSGRRVIFVAGFPPCTHVTVAGARDFATKRGQMLRDALETFEACRQAGAWSGAPYMLENPVGVLSSIPHIGKPDFYFQPYEYTVYEPNDSYTKKTCLWTGNGFVMPPAAIYPMVQQAIDLWRRDHPREGFAKYREHGHLYPPEEREILDKWLPDDRIHMCSPSDDRGDIRSETPAGFARAVFEANRPAWLLQAAA